MSQALGPPADQRRSWNSVFHVSDTWFSGIALNWVRETIIPAHRLGQLNETPLRSGGGFLNFHGAAAEMPLSLQNRMTSPVWKPQFSFVAKIS
jgi:hypothetical protein